MLIVVTYDVSTETSAGRARLRKVAKQCQNYGLRVQNSVFECKLDEAQFFVFRSSLLKLINENEDSLRFYRLGNNYQNRIEHYGSKEIQDIDAPLIF
ncbi:MAG: CRISPR-associated endonuclease Cas2 [Lachnospiraceae bacterium]|jgi:CRISPR-associated endoribonuclease Cas2|nr:CRISPR-associated endonuclease Cas2 [Lachnospiraceae bacterium]MCI9676773.1 CRISPR-associated endonuclease Cas2 [Lachnospiraceae bacterium]